MPNTSPTYKDKTFIKFVSDCRKKGLIVEHTDGGADPRPFVRCANFLSVKEATTARVQWLRKKAGFLVFPVKSKVRGTLFDVTL